MRTLSIAVLLLVGGCLDRADTAEREEAARTIAIDARRSLAITDLPILERFPLERVLQQIIDTGGVTGQTPRGLFQQWWDTQNRGGADARSPHCDAEIDPALGTVLNDFPYACREAPSEGIQVRCNPFTDAACKYIPVGLFNRFDLAPADGSHCGQYRIVYAKQTGIANGADRNLFIFEAALPWSYFGVTPAPGLHFGFALNSSDDDVPGTASQQSMLSSVPTRQLLNPTTWGTLELDPSTRSSQSAPANRMTAAGIAASGREKINGKPRASAGACCGS